MVLKISKKLRLSKELKSAKNKARGYMLLCVAAIYGLYVTLNGGDTSISLGTSKGGRKLSSAVADCAGQGAGEVVLHAFLTLYSFLGLAIVCDDWFVPSLEKISEKLNLSADVAGATFLAAGSSAPELFTSMADTFGAGSNIGLGTIVGSAMFNILIIVAMAAASTTETLNIDWKPVVRDCSFYTVSVLELLIFFNDGQILWWEGLIMTISYGLYILFMVFNAKIFAKCESKEAVVPTEVEEYEPGRRSSAHPHKGLFQGADREAVLEDGTKVKMEDGELPAETKDVKPSENAESEKKEEEEEEGYLHRFEFPAEDSALDKFLWVIGLPLVVVFTALIPDCSHSKAENWYVVTFVMSIGAIGGLCAAMVNSAGTIGCILSVDPFIMGTMVLAVGTSVPDALGSMIVARAGEADMAIANAVGSNVFDILLGLGFPWFLKGLIFPDEHIKVSTCGSTNAVIILVSTIGMFFLILAVSKWKMKPKLGIGFVVLYVFYIVYNVLKATKIIDESAGCTEAYDLKYPKSTGNATRLL
jgi:K+-dependent Na+/Ca+ exchanger-like protein